MLRTKGIWVVAIIAGLIMSGCMDSATVKSDESGQNKFDYKEYKTTYVYKTVGDLEIKADVLQVYDDVARPVVVWLHGEELVVGDRNSVLKPLKNRLFALGYDIVSFDYRLAPETKLPEIIQDLKDGFRWLQEKGPSLLDIDPSRIAVIGQNGYLALAMGHQIEPRPKVLVSIWGHGDLIGPWLREPNTEGRMGQAKMDEEVFKAFQQSHEVVNNQNRPGNGRAFYNYSRKLGNWPLMLTGFDPETEEEKFYPYMPLKNVTADYPPTYMIHGTADAIVPYEQAKLMEKEFIKHNVPYVLYTVEGGAHSLWRTPRQAQNEYNAQMIEFIDKYMKK